MLTKSNSNTHVVHAAAKLLKPASLPGCAEPPQPPPLSSPTPQPEEALRFVLKDGALFVRGICVGDAPIKFWARYLEGERSARAQQKSSKSRNDGDAPTTSAARSSSATSNSRRRPQPIALQPVPNSALAQTPGSIDGKGTVLELKSEHDSFRVLVQWSRLQRTGCDSSCAALDFDFVASQPVRLFEVYMEVSLKAPALATMNGPLPRSSPGTQEHFAIHGRKYHRQLRRRGGSSASTRTNERTSKVVANKQRSTLSRASPSSASQGGSRSKKTPAIWRAFSQGFQSWTYSRSRACETKHHYSIASRLGMSAMFLDTDSSKFGHRDGVGSSCMALMRAATMQDSLVFGATSTRVAATEVWCRAQDTDATVSFIVDYEGKPVPVSQSDAVFRKILQMKHEGTESFDEGDERSERSEISSAQDATTGTDTDGDYTHDAAVIQKEVEEEEGASSDSLWHHDCPVKRHHHVLHGERLIVLRSKSEHAALDWYAQLCTYTSFNGVPRNRHLLPTSTRGAIQYSRGQQNVTIPASAEPDGESAMPGSQLGEGEDSGPQASQVNVADDVVGIVDQSILPHHNEDETPTAEVASPGSNDAPRFTEENCGPSQEEYRRLQDLGRAPCGWGSWYQFMTKVKETDMHDMIDHFKNDEMLNSVIDFIQLDDGYASALGDWTSPNSRKFPSGLPDLAKRIRAAGFAPGIWTAPFMAGKSSKLLRDHRDWFLRHPSKPNKVLMAHFNPAWGLLKDAYTYSLDLSHPEVLDHLFKTFRTLREAGFVLFKVDFLLAGMRHGIRYNPNITRVEAYLNGLLTIRRAIGPGGFLLGCGAPLGPVQAGGIFDAMRVSRDTAGAWNETTFLRIVGTDCPSPCVRGAMQGNMTRWFMHRHAWQFNDPDCLVLRKSALSTDQVITQITLLAMTGGLLTFTDDMRTLCSARVDLARKVLPPTRLRGWPLEFVDVDHANVFVCMDPKYSTRGGVLAMVNWAIPSFKRVTRHDTHTFDVRATWHRALQAAKVWKEGLPEDEDKAECDEGEATDEIEESIVEAEAPASASPPVTFCFDFWSERLVCILRDEDNNNNNRSSGGVTGGGSDDVHVQPHAAAALQVTPCFNPNWPCVVGTNVHLLAIADGMVTWSVDEDAGRFCVKSHTVLYANVPRSVWVVVPGSCSTEALVGTLNGQGVLAATGCQASAKTVGALNREDGGSVSPQSVAAGVGEAVMVEVVVSSSVHVEDWEFTMQW